MKSDSCSTSREHGVRHLASMALDADADDVAHDRARESPSRWPDLARYRALVATRDLVPLALAQSRPTAPHDLPRDDKPRALGRSQVTQIAVVAVRSELGSSRTEPFALGVATAELLE